MSLVNKEKEALHNLIEAAVQEGRNQVLHLLMAIVDENVAPDHWYPDRAQFLYETAVEIVHRLRNNKHWSKEWPGSANWRDREGKVNLG